jgi:hypothetical protein
MTVLEAPELALSIAHSEDQVAGSLCCLHAVDRLIQGLIPLKHVSENEGKRIAESALLAKGIVGVGNSNLRNC